MYGSNFRGSRREVIALFVEGSFCPTSDGYSFFMLNLVKKLEASHNVIVIHNYRGWSALKCIMREVKSPVYLLPPFDFYGNTALIKKILLRHNAKTIWMTDYFMILKHGALLKKDFDLILIYNIHSVSSEVMKTIGAPLRDVRTIERYERFACTLSDGLICFSKSDKARLKSLGCDEEKIQVTAPLVPPRKFISIGRRKNIVFLGNMFYEPNAKAARFLIETIAPKLTQGTILHIVGDTPKSIVRISQNKSNVRYHGYIKDLGTFFNNCRLAIAPIEEGSGVRIKILEFFSYGIPVIGSRSSFEGIANPSNKAIVVNDTGDFANAINRALLDDKRLRQIVRNAYKYVRIAHDGRSIENAIPRVRMTTKRDNQRIDLSLPRQPLWVDELVRKGKYKKRQSEFSGPMLLQGREVSEFKARHVVLEGFPGAGKTTMLNRLSLEYNIAAVPQIIDLPIERLFGEEYYTRSEVEKHQMALRYNGISILDRNHTSLLAYAYAYDKRYGGNTFPRLSEKILEIKRQGLLSEPDLYIFLKASKRNSLARKGRNIRGIVKEQYMWNDAKFLTCLEEFYFLHYRNRDNVVFVDASRPTSNVYAAVLSAIRDLHAQKKKKRQGAQLMADAGINLQSLSLNKITRIIREHYVPYMRQLRVTFDNNSKKHISNDAALLLEFKRSSDKLTVYTLWQKEYEKQFQLMWAGLRFEVSRRLFMKLAVASENNLLNK